MGFFVTSTYSKSYKTNRIKSILKLEPTSLFYIEYTKYSYKVQICLLSSLQKFICVFVAPGNIDILVTGKFEILKVAL